MSASIDRYGNPETSPVNPCESARAMFADRDADTAESHRVANLNPDKFHYKASAKTSVQFKAVAGSLRNIADFLESCEKDSKFTGKRVIYTVLIEEV